MATPQISVIVPVYKAEAYLRRCVDSLLAQTFQDYEILLIDDGSPDDSGAICDAYARQDGRVRVFHKENGGVSSARQYGMDNASGEYTIHADPDDWVEPTMLEELYAKAKETAADMVICDFFMDEKAKESHVVQRPSKLDAETVCYEMFQRLLHGSCWNKLVRTSSFKQFNVQYPISLSYCEDLFVNTCLLSHNIKVAYLPKAFYHYDQDINENSLVHRSYEFIMEQWKILCQLLQGTLSDKLFNRIYPPLLYGQAQMILLGNFSTYIHSFKTDFYPLKSLINQLEISRKSKLLLWFAFYISPQFARALYRARKCFK